MRVDRRLQHVQALDDEDVGATHDDLRVRDDVVAEMRIERRTHLCRPAFHLTHEPQQCPPIVGLGESFALHQSASLQLAIGVEKAVGGDELDSRGVVPAGQKFAQEPRGGRLSHRDRACDSDHKGGALSTLSEKIARRPVQTFRPNRVEVDQATEREVDVAHLAEVESVTEPPQFHDLIRSERKRDGGR